jgi:SpoIIAA-like
VGMSWRIDEDIVLLESAGHVSLQEWRETLDAATSHRAFHPGMRVLHDVRLFDGEPSLEEVKARVAYLRERRAVHGIERWAVVVASGLHYGLGRIAQSQMRRLMPFRVFSDRAAAEEWIKAAVPD